MEKLSILLFPLFFSIWINKDYSIIVKKTSDFEITGRGTSEVWKKAEWIHLSQIKGDHSKKYETKVKALYSDKGLYFLFSLEDQKITASINENFKQLWKEDVVEIFLEPKKDISDYLEFELSPLNFILPLLVLNNQKKNTTWITLTDHVRINGIRHETSVEGGQKQSGGSIKKWKAEIFIPFDLLQDIKKTPPISGEEWKINLYRIDYDNGETKWWAWRPINRNFHEPKKFGILIFE